MLAAYAVAADAQNPLSALRVGEIDPPSVPADWVEVQVRAAALNHHDVWSLRGVGLPADRLPMILGCDAAGVTADGREVVVHAVINDPAYQGPDETYDPAGRCCRSATRGRWRRPYGCRPATCSTSPPGCRSPRRPACRPRGSPRTGPSSPPARCDPATRS